MIVEYSRAPELPVVRLGDGLLHYGALLPSLIELLDVAVHHFPARDAVVELGGDRMTYRQLWASAARVAGGLRSDGVEYGDRVAIALPNSVRWVQAFLGALLSGAVPVPVETADSVGVDYVIDGELPTGIAFIDEPAGLGELAVICRSRRGKAVELSNENILSAIETVTAAVGGGVRNLVLLPLSHASGCIDALLPTLATGGTVVLGGAEDPLDAIERERVDTVTATAADYRRAAGGMRSRAVASVRRICCAGGSLVADEVAEVRSWFPDAKWWSWWGATELSGIGLAMADLHPGSAGTACGGTELALSGPDAERGYGELLCRGPNVMRGYWRDPDATANSFTGNWFHTGEHAEIGRDGYVYLTPAAGLASAPASAR